MPVFVLGMHRSGTSVITHMASLLGVPLGKVADPMPSNCANPKGYSESSVLRSINDELLEILGGSWSAPPTLAPGWQCAAELKPFANKALAAFRSVYPSGEWIWKDPRISITLPFWLDLLDVRPVMLLAHRNPLEIWRSLAAREGFSKTMVFALWERYLRSILASVAGLPVFVIPHQELLECPHRWCAELPEFFDAHSIQREPSPSIEDVEAFLDSKLRHSAFSSADIEDDPIIRVEHRRLFAAMERSVGAHEAFVPPDLGPESQATEDVIAERRRIAKEQQRLERALMIFVDATARLEVAPPEEPARTVAMPYPADAADDVTTYRAWLDRTTAGADRSRAALVAQLAATPVLPLVTLVMALERPDPSRLRASVDSIRAQLYTHWELLFCTCGGGAVDLETLLASFVETEPRARVVRSAAPSLSLASNDALAIAGGDFVTFVGQHDRLDSEALARVMMAAMADGEADVLYTDEDRIDASGARSMPRFKPQWCPDLLLSQMYLGRLLVLRASLVREIGGFRDGFGDAHEYDLALRATERARGIVHVPAVLYHRDACPVVEDGGEALQAALASALDRRGEPGTVEPGLVPGSFRVRRSLSSLKKVSVIIPFRDQADVTERCLRTLAARAGYPHWEVVLVDNQSWEPETRALLPKLASDPRFRIVSYSQPFNWAAINNWAASLCDGEILLFLNNDTEAIVDGWMTAMVEHVQRKEVGVVGARLLYPDGRVQHAGVLLGINGICGHAFHALSGSSSGYGDFAKTVRNYSAITGACMMVRREVFGELHGFDTGYPVAYNDIDFCLRARQGGYLIVYTPFAELIHHEAISRGVSTNRAESRTMIQRWTRWIDRDPYFHPSLSRRSPHFSLPSNEEPCLWKDLLSSLAA